MSPEEAARRSEAYGRVPFPDRLVTYWDIAKGVGEVVLHTVTDQFLHETPSDHFKDTSE